MLVLKRSINESIIINDNIVIRVQKITGSNVTLGIEAPKEIGVYREEIYKTGQMERHVQ